MKNTISTFAPGVTEVFSAVDVKEKTKSIEFESKLFHSKSQLSGLKDNSLTQEDGGFELV